MIKAVIFDCFGVIRPDRLIQAYEHFGGNPVADKQFIQDTLRASNTGLIPRSRTVIAEHLGVSVDDWLAFMHRGDDIDHVLLDYIVELRKSYRTAILSNASKALLIEVVGEDQLKRCFDAVVESGSLGFAKPDPQIYEYAADQLGVRFDECVFTDDNDDYCEAARSVGMQAIHYQSFGQFKRDLEELLAKSEG